MSVVNIDNGTVLPNGATVIAYKVTEFGKCIVLALFRSGEYVTWVVDEAGNAFWGHYFAPDRFFAAVDAFRGRD